MVASGLKCAWSVAGGNLTPRLSQNRLRGIPRNGLYVQSVVMLRMGPAGCVLPAEGDFGW